MPFGVPPHGQSPLGTPPHPWGFPARKASGSEAAPVTCQVIGAWSSSSCPARPSIQLICTHLFRRGALRKHPFSRSAGDRDWTGGPTASPEAPYWTTIVRGAAATVPPRLSTTARTTEYTPPKIKVWFGFWVSPAAEPSP